MKQAPNENNTGLAIGLVKAWQLYGNSK